MKIQSTRYTNKKRKIKWIGIALLSMLALYLIAIVVYAVWDDGRTFDTDGATAESMQWMENLPDEISLAKISIPGTHDSATKYTPFHYSFQCQDTTISEQLLAGYRFLDVRFSVVVDDEGAERLCLKHGIGHCRISGERGAEYMYLEDMTASIRTFLNEHPSECVILLVDEATDGDDECRIAELLDDWMRKEPELWFLENRIPTLGEVRGKIILATRYGDVAGYGQKRCGLDLRWQSQNSWSSPEEAVVLYELNDSRDYFNVQNWFRITPDDKWIAVEEALNGNYVDEHTLLLNYLTISRGYFLLPCPKDRAFDLNARLSDYSFESGHCYGIVIVDFGTRELAEKIYRTNITYISDGRSQNGL